MGTHTYALCRDRATLAEVAALRRLANVASGRADPVATLRVAGGGGAPPRSPALPSTPSTAAGGSRS